MNAASTKELARLRRRLADRDRTMRGLTQRIRVLEDEAEINRLIVRYCFAVDSGRADDLAALFTEDAVYELDGAYVADGEPYRMVGRDQVRAMVESERHRALRPRCAHTVGPTVIVVDGDSADVTGYSRVYWGAGHDAELHRISTNYWRCRREGGRWLISFRTSVAVGSVAAQRLLESGL